MPRTQNVRPPRAPRLRRHRHPRSPPRRRPRHAHRRSGERPGDTAGGGGRPGRHAEGGLEVGGGRGGPGRRGALSPGLLLRPPVGQGPPPRGGGPAREQAHRPHGPRHHHRRDDARLRLRQRRRGRLQRPRRRSGEPPPTRPRRLGAAGPGGHSSAGRGLRWPSWFPTPSGGPGGRVRPTWQSAWRVCDHCGTTADKRTPMATCCASLWPPGPTS